MTSALYALACYVDALVANEAAKYALEQGDIAREQERIFKECGIVQAGLEPATYANNRHALTN